jgi:hypothetical protein
MFPNDERVVVFGVCGIAFDAQGDRFRLTVSPKPQQSNYLISHRL